MKAPLIATGIVCLISIVSPSSLLQADPTPDEEKFLVVEEGQRITPNTEIPALSDLPKELLAELGNYDLGKAEGGVPTNLRGFAIDLNHDGKKEYFVANPALTGSGGVGYLVFAEISKKWSLIGEFQGAIYIFPVKKGWPRLVTIGRGGAGSWSKTYSEFKDGKYKDKMIERYERGTITKEPVEEE